MATDEAEKIFQKLSTAWIHKTWWLDLIEIMHQLGEGGVVVDVEEYAWRGILCEGRKEATANRAWERWKARMIKYGLGTRIEREGAWSSSKQGGYYKYQVLIRIKIKVVHEVATRMLDKEQAPPEGDACA